MEYFSTLESRSHVEWLETVDRLVLWKENGITPVPYYEVFCDCHPKSDVVELCRRTAVTGVIVPCENKARPLNKPVNEKSTEDNDCDYGQIIQTVSTENTASHTDTDALVRRMGNAHRYLSITDDRCVTITCCDCWTNATLVMLIHDPRLQILVGKCNSKRVPTRVPPPPQHFSVSADCTYN